MDRFRDKSSGVQPHWQIGVAAYEIRNSADGRTNYLNSAVPAEHFFPEDSELKLSNTIAHTSMNTEAERKVLTCVGAIDIENISVFEY